MKTGPPINAGKRRGSILQPMCRICFKRVMEMRGKYYDSLDPDIEHKCDKSKAGVAAALRAWAGRNE